MRRVAPGAAAVLAALALAGCATVPRGGDLASAGVLSDLRGCGVRVAPGTLVYDAGAAVVTLARAHQFSDRETHCLARTLIDWGADFRSPGDLAFAHRYAAAWEVENRAVGARMAALWLRRNHKPAPPRFRPRHETLPGYVRKLERICDAPAQSIETSDTTVRIPWIEHDERANEQVSCVYLAALASNLRDSGIRIVSLPGRSAAARD